MTTYHHTGEQVAVSDETRFHQAQPVDDPADFEPPYSDEPIFSEERQRRRFGGFNWGADFFGWLITAALVVLLAGAAAAAAAALGKTGDVLSGQTAGDPRTVGIFAAAVSFGVLVVSYYSGGYVAGRMSRFDGGKQGFGVWLIGLLLAGAGVGVALLLGGRYVDHAVTALPVPPQQLGIAGLVAAAAGLFCSLLAAVVGGKVGCRYHRKVDDAGYL